MSLAQATIYGAFIGAGSAIVGLIVAQVGNLLFERRRERRAAMQQRDQAIAELLVAVVDLISGVQAVRAAYMGQGGWRENTRRAATLLAAFGAEYGSPKGLRLEEVLEWRRLARFFAPLLAALERLDDRQRVVALDLATVLLPRASRFYSAVAVLTLGRDTRIADAVRKLAPEVGALLEVMASSTRKYERARRRAERALGRFRAVADGRRSPR